MNELKRLVSQRLNPKPTTTVTPTTTSTSQSVTTTYSFQYGWICPKCGAVMAPNQASCTFCVPTFNVTTATKPSVSPTVICTGQPYEWNLNT